MENANISILFELLLGFGGHRENGSFEILLCWDFDAKRMKIVDMRFDNINSNLLRDKIHAFVVCWKF